jgi:hypothetical protein
VKDQLKESSGYDFSTKKNLRSIFSSYVWTAAGGLHKEEHSIANSHSETYSASSSLKVGGGVEAQFSIGAGFGFYIEGDIMAGGTFTMTATKVESTSNGFKLLSNVAPTDFLAAPKIDKDHVFKGYESTPAPGKVDAYRYMSFLLAPDKENFAALQKEVIDPNWLSNSTSAAANAMNAALKNTESQPWRVLHRTTYVSRVPASFQPVKDDTSAPKIVPPANLSSNDWLVRIVEGKLPKEPAPTPVDIGNVIDQVLGVHETPGILKDIIPWWSDFYDKAKDPKYVEFKELADLRVDLLYYMVSKYEADD